jgi:GNAT superfamily N-acetyltransferase
MAAPLRRSRSERLAQQVGLAVVVPRGSEYEVLSLWTSVRRRGVGRALLEHSFADARGCSRVWLTTTNDNLALSPSISTWAWTSRPVGVGVELSPGGSRGCRGGR